MDSNLADYIMAVHADAPEIDVAFFALRAGSKTSGEAFSHRKMSLKERAVGGGVLGSPFDE